MDSIVETTNLLEHWDKEYNLNQDISSVLNKTTDYNGETMGLAKLLEKIAEIVELEKGVWYKSDPDPFDDRHPGRADPNCILGHVMKVLFKNDNFMSKLVSTYMTGRDPSLTDLHINASRLLLDIMPGLETTVIFQENETLVKDLIEWTNNRDEPLSSYAVGLLASAMEIQDVAASFKECNAYMVPKMMKKLIELKNESLALKESSSSTSPSFSKIKPSLSASSMTSSSTFATDGTRHFKDIGVLSTVTREEDEPCCSSSLGNGGASTTTMTSSTTTMTSSTSSNNNSSTSVRASTSTTTPSTHKQQQQQLRKRKKITVKQQSDQDDDDDDDDDDVTAGAGSSSAVVGTSEGTNNNNNNVKRKNKKMKMSNNAGKHANATDNNISLTTNSSLTSIANNTSSDDNSAITATTTTTNNKTTSTNKNTTTTTPSNNNPDNSKPKKAKEAGKAKSNSNNNNGPSGSKGGKGGKGGKGKNAPQATSNAAGGVVVVDENELLPVVVQSSKVAYECTSSDSCWDDVKSMVIGKFCMSPLSLDMKQRLILMYLQPMGEYQELVGHVYEHQIMDLLFFYIDLKKNKDVRLAFEALKYLAALLCHKRFAIDFLQAGGIQKLLEVRRPSVAATGVSMCLYYLAYFDDPLERMYLLPHPILTKLVDFALWLLECSHESGRVHATMFFGFSFLYRVIVEIFDQQDGLRKLFNLISTLRIMNLEESRSNLTDDELFTNRQSARHVVVAIRRYLEAHVFMKSEQVKRMNMRTEGGTSLVETPANKPLKFNPDSIQDSMELLLECMPNKNSWKPVNDLLKLGAIQIFCQLLSISSTGGQYSGKVETLRSTLDSLAICCIVPKAQLALCNNVKLPDDLLLPGISILLDLASGEHVIDPEVQKAALGSIINSVCGPLTKSGSQLNRSSIGAGGGGIQKRRGSLAPCEDPQTKVWQAVRSNNGIMVLMNLLSIKLPMSEADAIRAMACRALVGLSRCHTVKQIISKLPMFSNGQLQQLMWEPVLQDKRSEHAKFCKFAIQLIQEVSGKLSDQSVDPSLERMRKADIVAQTKIVFNGSELLKLIHAHLIKEGLTETAASLEKESKMDLSISSSSLSSSSSSSLSILPVPPSSSSSSSSSVNQNQHPQSSKTISYSAKIKPSSSSSSSVATPSSKPPSLPLLRQQHQQLQQQQQQNASAAATTPASATTTTTFATTTTAESMHYCNNNKTNNTVDIQELNFSFRKHVPKASKSLTDFLNSLTSSSSTSTLPTKTLTTKNADNTNSNNNNNNTDVSDVSNKDSNDMIVDSNVDVVVGCSSSSSVVGYNDVEMVDLKSVATNSNNATTTTATIFCNNINTPTKTKSNVVLKNSANNNNNDDDTTTTTTPKYTNSTTSTNVADDTDSSFATAKTSMTPATTPMTPTAKSSSIFRVPISLNDSFTMSSPGGNAKFLLRKNQANSSTPWLKQNPSQKLDHPQQQTSSLSVSSTPSSSSSSALLASANHHHPNLADLSNQKGSVFFGGLHNKSVGGANYPCSDLVTYSLQPPSVSLSSIVTTYLQHQHTACKNPVIACPPFSLLNPHKCPEPKFRTVAPSNITSRLFRRQAFPRYGGLEGGKLDRKFIYSRFRPLRSFRDAEENVFSCCSFSADEEYVVLGLCTGELKMFNISTAVESNYFHCHSSPVIHCEPSRDGELWLTSSAWGTPLSALWKNNSLFDMMHAFNDDEYAEFSKLAQDRIVGTKDSSAQIYDVTTGLKLMTLYDANKSNNYTKNRATFNPTDDLILNDGVLWDIDSGKVIHKFDKFNSVLSGLFHPNGLEIIINSQVWDVRTFHLLHTVEALDQCKITFNKGGKVIYGAVIETDDDDPAYNNQPQSSYGRSFRTFDGTDYSNIATIDVKKLIFDLCTDSSDCYLAVVENLRQTDDVNEESCLRLYEIGKLKDGEDDQAEEEEENGEDDDDEDDDDDDSVTMTFESNSRRNDDDDDDDDDVANDDDEGGNRNGEGSNVSSDESSFVLDEELMDNDDDDDDSEFDNFEDFQDDDDDEDYDDNGDDDDDMDNILFELSDMSNF